jgi:hypothetical protein
MRNSAPSRSSFEHVATNQNGQAPTMRAFETRGQPGRVPFEETPQPAHESPGHEIVEQLRRALAAERHRERREHLPALRIPREPQVRRRGDGPGSEVPSRQREMVDERVVEERR